MRIDHLEIRNFRRFIDAKFDFHPRFNLLVGENGAGKSSLLDALAVAAGGWLLGIDGAAKRHIDARSEVRRARFVRGKRPVFEPQFPVEVSARGVVIGKRVEWTRSLAREGGRTTRADASSMRDLAEARAREVRSGAARPLPLICHYGAGRLWKEPKDMAPEGDEEPVRYSRLDGYRLALDPRIDFASLMRWLRREKYIALQEGREGPHFIAVKRALLGCVEGARSVDYDVKEEDLVVDFEDEGPLPYRLASDGRRSMIALVADIGYRASLLNPQLGERVLEKTRGVVLIDEIDLHLHPRWQRHVISDLAEIFRGVQFFATTHSPQIVGEVPKEEILVLRGDGAHHPSISIGADSNWILEHVLGGNERTEKARTLIRAVEEAFDRSNWKLARRRLGALEELFDGDVDGEVTRLRGTLHALETLSHADD